MSRIHVRIREWKTVGPDDPSQPELRGATLGDSNARALAARLTAAGVVEVTELRAGLRIAAFAHVGRIQLGTLTITIEPKIGSTDLLRLLRYAYGLRNLRLLDAAGFSTAGDLLQDLIAAQLHAEVSELVHGGLAKTYVARAEMLSSPRGRIDLAAIARRMPLTEARLLCTHHVRSTDDLLNRTVTAGVLLASSIAQDAGLRRSLRSLGARLTAEVGELRLDSEVLQRARAALNRLTAAYEPALRLTELLYACSAVSLDGETTCELRGFLLDMNRFFQALLGRFLADHLTGFAVREEQALTEMMRYMPGLNPRRRRSPAPRPDFVVTTRQRIVALLDAKYRDLWERELPREMLYQLAIYALSQPDPATATILYPTMATDAKDAVVEIIEPLRGSARGRVALRPVVISELLGALQSARPAAMCQALAHRYAFGASHPALSWTPGGTSARARASAG